jgi:hypothetical protein
MRPPPFRTPPKSHRGNSRVLAEFLVGADRGDAAAIEHDDAIGAAHRAEAVRDDEGGASGHDAVHRLEDLLLGPGVDGGGGIVEDEDGRIE